MIRFIIFAILISVTNLNAQKSQSPHGKLNRSCGECHSTSSWKLSDSTIFNHNSTGFSLTGYHKNVSCKSCHNDLKFAGQNSECTACHVDVHRSELGNDCKRCHDMNSWIITDMKQKHQQTRFPLLGRHAQLDCGSCHERASFYRFAGTPITCIGCHEPDYRATLNPSHVKELFPVDCRNCHNFTASSWGGSFDHSLTAFPLTGAHRAIICIQCHKNNQFRNLSSECYNCHSADFTSAISLDHVSAGVSRSCQICHTTIAWTPSTFNHASTKFNLTGKHRTISCQSCHLNSNYLLVYSGCYTCHQTDYQNSDNPNHLTGGFNTDCSQCHSTTLWQPATFDHSTTKFDLTGKHKTITCQSCHSNGNYQLVYSGCYSCHQNDYQNTNNPNHLTENFDTDCSKCHSTDSWSPATFDHSITKFPLTGQHTTTQCLSCHTGGNYQLTYSDCYACHQDDFIRPTDPNHAVANFPHDCSPCHTTSAWSPSTFNHDQQYFRIYSGAHQEKWTLCTDCHTTQSDYKQYSCVNCHEHNQTDMNAKHTDVGNYVYLSSECFRCHQNVK
jgi:nitrate/TMAO reductase-like tetraheme cytochrome c subunit